MKRRHLRNCHTCRHNTTVVVDDDGVVRPCTPWCRPYQEEWADDEPTVRPDGVIAWARKVGLDEENMPAERTPEGCPRWAKR